MSDSAGFHGGEVVRLARELGLAPAELLDFSSNADSTVAPITAQIAAAAPHPFQRYPDDRCDLLRAALAEREGVAPEQILVLHGSAEGIHLAVAGLRPRRALLVGPLFGEYERACRGFGVPFEVYPLREENDFQPGEADVNAIARAGADLVVVCSPNNPSGAAFAGLHRLLAAVPGATVLLDATYREFLHPGPALADHCYPACRGAVEQGAGARLLLLGSFTKYFFCPGIRLGFAVARPETLDRLLAVRAPWMVSDHAQGVGQAMLRRLGEYRAARADLPRRREALRRGLLQTGLFAWACRPAANFVTLRLARSTPRVLAEFLLARRMVVRTCDNITGMPPGYVRIQVKDDAENAALISAIAEFPG